MWPSKSSPIWWPKVIWMLKLHDLNNFLWFPLIKLWIFIGRTDSETKTPVLCPPDATNWLIGKDPDSGKDWRQEEKRTMEDEMVGWHHRLDGHEFEEALEVGDGQGGAAVHLVAKSRTQLNNWTEVKWCWQKETYSLYIQLEHMIKKLIKDICIYLWYCHRSGVENPELSEQGTVCSLGSWALVLRLF